MRPHDNEMIVWWRDCINSPVFDESETRRLKDRPTDRPGYRIARMHLRNIEIIYFTKS